MRKKQGPSVGLEWGILAAPVGGGVLSACQIFAAAWEKPSPEILIQGRNRTGFSTGSWQCQGARGRKKPRGQEGSCRAEGELGGSDGALTLGQQSQPSLLGPLQGLRLCLICTGLIHFLSLKIFN